MVLVGRVVVAHRQPVIVRDVPVDAAEQREHVVAGLERPVPAFRPRDAVAALQRLEEALRLRKGHRVLLQPARAKAAQGKGKLRLAAPSLLVDLRKVPGLGGVHHEPAAGPVPAITHARIYPISGAVIGLVLGYFGREPAAA